LRGFGIDADLEPNANIPLVGAVYFPPMPLLALVEL
jgi:hypothetical protein